MAKDKHTVPDLMAALEKSLADAVAVRDKLQREKEPDNLSSAGEAPPRSEN